MFSMITNQAIQESSRIETQLFEISGQLMELDQTIRILRSISGIEEVIAELEHLYLEMESECLILRQMMLGLNKTILSYLSCEGGICDNNEQNILCYTRRETDRNDFSYMSDILNGI